MNKNCPKCKVKYYSTINDGYLAVKHGKIDAFAFDRHTLQYVAAQNPDLALMDQKIADEFIVVGSSTEHKDLIAKVNAFIRQYKSGWDLSGYVQSLDSGEEHENAPIAPTAKSGDEADHRDGWFE